MPVLALARKENDMRPQMLRWGLALPRMVFGKSLFSRGSRTLRGYAVGESAARMASVSEKSSKRKSGT